MSYDIRLIDPASYETLWADEPHHLRGGTYEVGGSRELWLNVTYNYGKHFYRVLDAEKGIRALYGKSAAETIPMLQAAIARLKDDVSDDYWEPTEGNARQALCNLLILAQMRPDGIWDGD